MKRYTLLSEAPQLAPPQAQNPGRADMSASDPIARTSMSLEALARRCLIESERFYRGQPHDPRFAYELFRRAIVDQDQAAWSYVYQNYSAQVERWVRRNSAFGGTGENCEVFINEAFLRFFKSITPARFAAFTTLAALLNYLQRCASCVVIDSVRADGRAGLLPEEAIPERVSQSTVDEEAIDKISKAEFWDHINRLLHDEAERVVIFFSYMLGMQPCTIYARRPDLFESVRAVYSVKRNVLERFKRNPALRSLLEA